VDFHQVSTFTEDDWVQACHEATPDRCRSLMEIRKQVTLEIRLGGLSSFRRSPWQRAVRKADSWRFDPEYLSPTQELIQQLRQKGNEEGAAHLQAKLDALPPEVQRRRAKLVVRGETKKEGPDRRTAGEDPLEIDKQEDPSVGIVPISTDRELAESYEEDVRRANREALNRPRVRDWASPALYP